MKKISLKMKKRVWMKEIVVGVGDESGWRTLGMDMKKISVNERDEKKSVCEEDKYKWKI